ncbi:MAG: NUDIX domain-containing protein [Verrucomicrobiales bacterium]
MKTQFTYSHPRPAVTVDAILLDRSGAVDSVLLVQRADPPFAGSWAFPGGFLEIDESAEQAVARELAEETGIEGVRLKSLCTASGVDRDPRGRVISIVFLGEVRAAELAPRASSDAAAVGWFDCTALPDMAFDHRDILRHALGEIAQE